MIEFCSHNGLFQIWVGRNGSWGGISDLQAFLSGLGLEYRLQDHGLDGGILIAFYCFIMMHNVHLKIFKNRSFSYLRQVYLSLRGCCRWWTSVISAFDESLERKKGSPKHCWFLFACFCIFQSCFCWRSLTCLCRRRHHHLQLRRKHQLQHQSPRWRLQILVCVILLIKTNIVFSFSSSIVLLMWIKNIYTCQLIFPSEWWTDTMSIDI